MLPSHSKEMPLYLYVLTIITIKLFPYLMGSGEPHALKDVSERDSVQELCSAPHIYLENEKWHKMKQNNYGKHLLGTALKFTCVLEEVLLE